MSEVTYYAAGTGADGTQLWILTATGATITASELATLYPATQAVVPNPSDPGHYELGSAVNDGDPAQFTNFGGGTLFVASGLHTGRELFVTDGTAAGTHLVVDLTPGYTKTANKKDHISYTTYSDVQSSDPTEITAVGATRAVFSANNGTQPAALFATDGTAAGTTQLTAYGLYAASNITAFGADALFEGTSGEATAAGPAGTPGLWITDGTQAGTRPIAGPTDPGQPYTTNANAAGGGFTVVATAAGGTEAFFAGTTAAAGTELWVTNGTDAGTVQVADIDPGAGSSSPAFITALGVGRAILTANDGTDGPQLWITDGTAGGTALLKVIDPTNDNAFQRGFSGFTTAMLGGQTEAVFSAYDGVDSDPWVTDGTSAGTFRLLDYTNAYAGNFTAFDGRVFFTAQDPTHGRELWVTDGTVAGTVLFDDIDPGAAGSAPTDLHVVGTELVFTADDGGGPATWETDGTLAGTQIVTSASAVDLASLATQAAPCFARGTRLLGPRGPVAVEDVREGDLLLTRDGTARPVVWVGDRRVDCRRHPMPEKVWPVRVRRDAFAAGVPSADVLLSPDHAVLVDGALIPIGRLVNDRTVLREPVAAVHYFHIELPLHDVLLAEGLPVESFLDTGNRRMFAGQPAVALHPDFGGPDSAGPGSAGAEWVRLEWEASCAPLVLTGARLERAREILRARDEARAALAA
jgi:ELWxxDGT repeat protein